MVSFPQVAYVFSHVSTLEYYVRAIIIMELCYSIQLK